jgi:hypothetical protein
MHLGGLTSVAAEALKCLYSTPHFDRVAEQGIPLQSAFTTNPKCASSRASILTGRHTCQNRECCLHWSYWPDDLPVYLYVRNFAPHRWPAGNPETHFTNCDSSPTRTRIQELHESGDSGYWQLAFGKRPAEELFGIVEGPFCMRNMAAEPGMAGIRQQLWLELEQELRRSGDPRIEGRGGVFEQCVYVDEAPHPWAHYLKGDFTPQTY